MATFSQTIAITQQRPRIAPVNTPFTTIDLVPEQAYEVMERANRVMDICGSSTQNPRCVARIMSSSTYIIRLYTAPDFSAKPAGAILMTVSPGEGLADVEFIAHTGAYSRAMTRDDGDSDWGYDSPFRYTILERQGDWVKLPREPFPEPVWINAKQSLGRVYLTSVEAEDLYTIGERKLFVLAVLKDGLRVRDEQAGDMPCSDAKPKIKPLEPADLTFDQLYDYNGHFLMKVTYTRGC